MRYVTIVVALALSAAVYVTISRPESRPAPLELVTDSPIVEPWPSYTEPDSVQESLPAEASEAPSIEPTEIEDTAIDIGEPMHPDDPFTWPQIDNTEVTNIGEPMDPYDPSTWPQSDNTEVINIGEPMDPYDPSTWPDSDSMEVINIGEPMDPYDPSTWPQSGNTEVINIGESMDLDNLYVWPR